MIYKKLMLVMMAAAPIVELRGAIPMGIAFGMNNIEIFILSVIGATLPVPILIIFFKEILKWSKENKYLHKVANYVDNTINKKSKLISKKYKFIGILLYVGATIPPTGAWSGAMIASVLKLSLKEGLLAIFLGNVVSAVIVFNLAKIAIFFHNIITLNY